MSGINHKKESVELIAYLLGGSGKPWTNKQYPTLAGIYLRLVYDTTSDECFLLSLSIKNFPDFQERIKAKHFHLKYVTQRTTALTAQR